MTQDIPREGDDIYRIENDRDIAERIKALEKANQSRPDDFETVMQLGKLYAITSMSPKRRMSLLKKARQLNPKSPEPYKYLGMVHLDAFYQFNSAIEEMETYVRQKPDDVFGHNYLGYLYYCEKRYKSAIKELNKAIALRPDNCYAYGKLSRSYAAMYLDASDSDPKRSSYRKKAILMFEKAADTETVDPRRIKWLKKYLTRKKIIE